jgi:hypothetical protein
MIACSLRSFAALGFLGLAQSASAGIYCTIDPLQDVQWSRDYKGVFEGVIARLGNIAATKLDKDVKSTPIRERYLLLEAAGREGLPNFKTLEQKLNYSAVLIRRGKAYEAVQILQALERTENFLVLSQLAMAQFLSGNFRDKAVVTQQQALDLWPETLDKVDPEQRNFLELAGIRSDYDLQEFRKIEGYLRRLMVLRHKEGLKPPKGETVDEIFLDDDRKPVRFLNEDGKFEVGRIARDEKAKLPRNAVEYVEQLLIWMPTDQRLKWLLGEVLNASAMDLKDGDPRNEMIRSTYRIFQQLDGFSGVTYGAAAIKERRRALEEVVEKLPPIRAIDPTEFKIRPPEQPDQDVYNYDWWRTLGVGFATGLVVGMFALWQFQEVRRRRQNRA